MRPLAMVGLLLAASVLGGCACPCTGTPSATGGPPRLAQRWLIGIEPMRGDVPPTLPYTNRFLADLSAMPNVPVVYLGEERNGFLFDAAAVGKLRVAPWLHGEGNCMTLTYTIFQAGQQQGVFGLGVPPLAAGDEPDPACVDRAATAFYQAMARQGL